MFYVIKVGDKYVSDGKSDSDYNGQSFGPVLSDSQKDAIRFDASDIKGSHVRAVKVTQRDDNGDSDRNDGSW